VRNDPRHSRTAGKRIAAIRPSPSRSKSPRCLPPPTRWSRWPGSGRKLSAGNGGRWNEQIEDWPMQGYRPLAQSRTRRIYMRIGFSAGDANARSHGYSHSNRRMKCRARSGLLISPDALALCDSAFAPLMIRAFSTPSRRSTRCSGANCRRSYWYRYNNDGYGEHATALRSTGRNWPALAC